MPAAHRPPFGRASPKRAAPPPRGARRRRIPSGRRVPQTLPPRYATRLYARASCRAAQGSARLWAHDSVPFHRERTSSPRPTHGAAAEDHEQSYCYLIVFITIPRKLFSAVHPALGADIRRLSVCRPVVAGDCMSDERSISITRALWLLIMRRSTFCRPVARL